MSRIESLINEYCPAGVEYVKLESLVDYIQPTKYLVNSTNYNSKFHLPVLPAGQTFIFGVTHDDDGI